MSTVCTTLRPDVVEDYAVAREPVAEGGARGEHLLNLVVAVDLTLLHVDHHHLSGLQATLLLDFGGGEGEGAGFGGEHHGVVVGDQISGGAQAVAVEHAACIAAVAEEEGGGAVPCLHGDGMIFIKCLQGG